MTFRRLVRGCLLLAVLTCVVGGNAVAQTDYSPRIRSMGTGLAGIVDDPFTDAFLNPARVGDMPGRGAWFGRLPSHFIRFLYPGIRNDHFWGALVFPAEGPPSEVDWELYVSFEPYSLGLFVPVSRDLKLSVAGEISVYGRNDLDETANLGFRYPPSIADLRGEQSARGYDSGQYHGLVDVALGSGSPDSDGLRWGVRAAAGYDRSRNQSVRTTSAVNAEPGSEDLTLYYTYRRDHGDFERSTVELSAGVFRNTGVFAQAVVGVSAGREVLERATYDMREDDEDYDGDGNGPGDDNSPMYQLHQDGYESNREYDTGRIFGRLGLRWGRRVSSWHRLTVFSASGDGTGEYLYRDVMVEVTSELLAQDLSFRLEGESSGYRFANSVGFVDQVLDNVLFVCAVEAVIQHDEFEEDGSGSGTIQSAMNGSSARFEGPYTQKAKLDRNIWNLSIPVAFEWDINEYAAWRFGVDFRASRIDSNADITQDTDTMGFPDLGFLPVTNSADDLRFQTATYFSSGLTLSFRDRVKLELLTGPTSGSISVVYFSSAILEFRF